MRLPLLIASALALAACAAPDAPSTGNGLAGQGNASTNATHATTSALQRGVPRPIAGLADSGHLLAYTGATPIKRSAYTWHEVALSEAHAMGAIVSGTLALQSPDGTPIRLRYDRHVEHEDGNWTWIGRPEGARPGTEAIITFGPDAVFGSVPNGNKPPLAITSVKGRTFVMETNPLLHASARKWKGRDAVVPPALAGARDKVMSLAAAQPQQLTAQGAVPEAATVDVVIGYTNKFALDLGGTSQANTRLTYLVDVTNQAFTNSQVVGRVRMVRSVAVNYPDATDNETALRELTGVACTETTNGNLDCHDAPVPATLQPLANARVTYRGDLMVLVRQFNEPENEGCGIAWLLGGGQVAIGMADRYAAVSVVSDSAGLVGGSDGGYYCRDETFAHEVAHNMGSAHDRQTAAGDGTLSADEYGRFAYSFGYKTAQFYTIMAYGDGQEAVRVYSNPRISICEGQVCGTPNDDNAKSLGQTIPMIASFYGSIQPRALTRNDVNGDGKSDILLRNGSISTTNVWYWLKNGPTTTGSSATTLGTSYSIAATGDFNGDGKLDIVWTSVNRDVRIWFGNGSGWGGTPTTPGTFPTGVANYAAGWKIVGAGDIDGDGKSDIVFRNPTLASNNVMYWIQNGATRVRTGTATMGLSQVLSGLGDFNGDGKLDLVFVAGRDVRLWFGNGTSFGATSATPGTYPAFAGSFADGWQYAGAGDVDGDGKDDIISRSNKIASNNFSYWVMNGYARTRIGFATMGASYNVAALGDYNGDGKLDVAWTSANRDVRMWLGNGTGFGATTTTPGSYPAGAGTYASGWFVVP
ncbi:FG-GAP-like repeat-containing protein [Lysobacter sp. A6]|uniref:FG-GAP-like repeat-containing protein n=1 Tax=Noviluteimonas lactosilytica TaxID=2888523 RepID=A0ABS8JGC3_9GAMM|nr:FG-GAP-like repeat-containing protein [Lysobacter lactosilyticus]MCC8362590.1 FG-GAP-like repeat-containing protein [Lysobacter lactosilyticus]